MKKLRRKIRNCK